jgi:hypothetical protein
MAVVLSDSLKRQLDTTFGAGGATKFINLITSSTALDGPTKWYLDNILDGIGEASAFVTNCTAHTAPSVAAMTRLEHELNGRGLAEEFRTAILDGTVT